MIVLSFVFFLILSATDSYSQGSLNSDIAKALRKSVTCEKIEIKSTPEGTTNGKLRSLLIRLVALPKHILPADYVTLQYTAPEIDVAALRKSNSFKMKSYSNCKVGMLVSEKSIRQEFYKRAKRFNLQDRFSIKFTPPYIELQFDIPAGAIPLKDRKLVEKFIRNKRLEGYAALRLEIHGTTLIASPVKVILNHFLVPMPLVSELKKRINPVFHIPRIRPFEYDLVKVDILKQHVFLSN